MDILKVKVSDQCYDALISAGINSLKVLLTSSETHLMQLTHLDAEDLKNVVKATAEVVIASKFTIAVHLAPWKRISTGCSQIDEIIRGGIPVNGITEIVGPSGVGKTQLCLQLSLMSQLPEDSGGANKGVLYICTEDSFPCKRLAELAEKFTKDHQQCKADTINFNNNVFVEHSADFEQLRICLYNRLPTFLNKANIGLIIIDSIAGAFRSENLEVDYVKRSQQLHIIANQLLELGSKRDIAIVCTNQITDDPITGKSEPCLGLVWRNILTCRFSLNKVSSFIREFHVDFAPDLPNKTCQFTITDKGVVNI